tara:strand:+ start:589 stop:870 length:282 start_codon:yes stop_codon:yes gene_type:complete
MNKQDNNAKIDTIVAIEATELKNFKYQIDAVFADGTREVLFAKSAKRPGTLAHAFSGFVNGRGLYEALSGRIILAKNVPSHYEHCYVKTFVIA